MKKRLGKLDVVSGDDFPRKSPTAYTDPSPATPREKAYSFDVPLDSAPAGPTMSSTTSTPASGAGHCPAAAPVLPHRDVAGPPLPTTSAPIFPQAGTYAYSTPIGLTPSVDAGPAPDPLYTRPTLQLNSPAIPFIPGLSAPPVAQPIPGVSGGISQPLSNESLMCSVAYNIDRIANPEITVKQGAIDGVRRIDEIHVYVARFFDNRTVALGPGITGKAMAQHLKTLNERLRPLYEAYKIPTGFTNRLSTGAACMSWGGRDREDDHVLSESDFVSWTPNDFDKYTSPSTWALEPKSKPSQHIETWRTNAINMSRMFAALYGVEYLSERILCIEHLRQMHLGYPHKYPLGFAKNDSGTLNVRWCQDLKAMTDTLRLHAKAERPTSQQLQAVGMAVVNATGMTLFRRPGTFDMTSTRSYFVSEILRKLNDDKELQDWAFYHTANQKHPSRISGLPP